MSLRLIFPVFLSILFLAQPVAAGPAPSAQPPEPLQGLSVPPAQEEGLSGLEYLSMAEESYGSGDYGKAGELYRKALVLLEDPQEKAKAHERLAFIGAAFGRMDEAYAEFVEALKLDSAMKLDPDEVSPKVYEAFQKARDEVVREGTLVCNCDPPGAEVYLDGKLVGEAPVRKERIREGDYTLTLKKPGYETTTGKVTIKKDITLTVEDKMAEARGEITVNSVPPGAMVVVDGAEAGRTPLTVRRVASGSHKVVLKRDYFEPAEYPVEMETGGRGEVNATLKRRLVFIGLDGGRPAGTGAILKEFEEKMEGFRVVPVSLDALADRLKSCGLDPGSLGFMKKQKDCLELEDQAVLSGILEREGADLALVASVQDAEEGRALYLSLYSLSGGSGDHAAIFSKEGRGLEKAFGEYLDGWSEQGRHARPTVGARLADREGGMVEIVSVVPGYPAAAAGLAAGDVITAVDGVGAADRKTFTSLLKPGAAQQFTVLRGGRERGVRVTPVLAPAEVPVDSPGYLYNLALAGLQDSAGGSMDRLSLGNVLVHFGDHKKAVEAYKGVESEAKSGVCAGTALYRLGQSYERLGLWSEAAYAYRKALVLYPDATLGDADGPAVGPLAKGRLRELFRAGLVMERWWL